MDEEEEDQGRKRGEGEVMEGRRREGEAVSNIVVEGFRGKKER